MDEKEQDLTPEFPAQVESEGVLAEPIPGAEETTGEAYTDAAATETFTPEQILAGTEQPLDTSETAEAEMLAILEAIVYITDEPLSAKQIADAVQKPLEYVKSLLDKLVDELAKGRPIEKVLRR